MDYNYINYSSTLAGKQAFIAEVICPWLRALGYEKVTYRDYKEGGEYIEFEYEPENEKLRIDITADSIEAIVLDTARWIVEVHQQRI